MEKIISVYRGISAFHISFIYEGMCFKSKLYVRAMCHLVGFFLLSTSALYFLKIVSQRFLSSILNKVSYTLCNSKCQ